jgi:hypothetical protein
MARVIISRRFLFALRSDIRGVRLSRDASRPVRGTLPILFAQAGFSIRKLTAALAAGVRICRAEPGLIFELDNCRSFFGQPSK